MSEFTQAETWVHGYLTLDRNNAFSHWHILDSIPYHPDQSRYRAVGVEVWVFPDGSCVSQREAKVYHAHASIQDAVPLAEVSVTTMALEWVQKFRGRFKNDDRMLTELHKRDVGVPERFYCFGHNRGCVRLSDGSCVTWITLYPPVYPSGDVRVTMVAHASIEDAGLYACANRVKKSVPPTLPPLTAEERRTISERIKALLAKRKESQC